MCVTFVCVFCFFIKDLIGIICDNIVVGSTKVFFRENKLAGRGSFSFFKRFYFRIEFQF